MLTRKQDHVVDVFYYRCVVNRVWLKGTERTLHHFIKHDGLRLKQCINLIVKHKGILNAENMLRSTFPGFDRYFFHEILHLVLYSIIFCCQIPWIMVFGLLFWDPVDLLP